MRIHPEKTQDEEFELLRIGGYSGALNDKQFKYLKDLGYSGSLTDMFRQLDSTYEDFFTSNSEEFFTLNGFQFRIVK